MRVSFDLPLFLGCTGPGNEGETSESSIASWRRIGMGFVDNEEDEGQEEEQGEGEGGEESQGEDGREDDREDMGTTHDDEKEDEGLKWCVGKAMA